MSDVIIVNSSYKKKLFPIKDITANNIKVSYLPELGYFPAWPSISTPKRRKGKAENMYFP